jgi:squalene-associated FAD-dependent desaturase
VTDRKRVIIVGGGLAGLSAAETIGRRHPSRFDVTLLEAKRIVGGRAGSFSDATTGDDVDYCQHVAMGCCTNFLGLLDRCGLSNRIRRYQDLTFLHPDHPPSPFRPSRWLPAPLHLAGVLSSFRFLTAGEKSQIRRGLWKLMRQSTDSLIAVNAADWLAGAGQTDSVVEKFWDVVLVSALGEQTDRVSMGAARKVFIDGFAAAKGASDVCVPTRPLSTLIGQDLAAAVSSLGVRIETNSLVQRIDANRTVWLTDGRQHADADHIIVAVPWYRIGGLFDDESIRNLMPVGEWTDLPTSPITGIHLWFDRPITDRPHAVMVGTTAQWLFRDPVESDVALSDDGLNNRGIDPVAAGTKRFYYQVVISASSAARELPRSKLIETVMGELRHAFVDARDANLVAHRIVTDPRSVFSASPDVMRRRPPPHTALPWLHLAGDWVDTGWPATMEGAVIGGALAAASVFRQEKASIPPADGGLPRGWLARRLIRA